MNKTEQMALDWLKKELGYKDNEIIFNERRTPDFTCVDGKRFEVKFLYGNQLLFSVVQEKQLKDDDIILIFNRKGYFNQFNWVDRNKVMYNIKISNPNEGMTTVKLDKKTIEKLKQYGFMGETYDDLICRLLLKETKRKGNEKVKYEGAL